jgi:hypothetical protein
MQPPLTHIRFAAAKTKAWPVTRSNYPYRLALRCPPSPIRDTSDGQAESWVVAVNTPMADKISRYTVESCDWLAGLLKLIDLSAEIRPARMLLKAADAELLSNILVS